ncbi:complement factor H-like [Myripristis murdjan]|uniref:complement factor H-like n=1 Tax=Myripristis murdjan TaxID=586833 RepID=UPI0011760257|nr:complement factor H-like [Myripristis murdjan]
MHLIARGCALLLWMHTLTVVKSQECTRAQFVNGPLYDENFDTTNLEEKYDGGTQVRVNCNVGFTGFFRIMCVSGNWMPRGSKCQPRSCGHPGEAQFAEFHLEKGDDFVFGSEVVYTCQKGYQMVSRTNYRRCMAEGWDGVVPVCEAQQCPVINVEDGVQVIGDPEEATYGNVLRFRCTSNSLVLNGSAEIHCDETGEWSGPAPTCDEIICGPPRIEHGRVRGNAKEYKENDVLHFECDVNYKPTQGILPKCTKVGPRAEWRPTPLCEQVKCTILQSISGTRYEPESRNVFYPGDRLTVICGEDYWFFSTKETSTEVTCQQDGTWTHDPVCSEIKCPRLNIEHASTPRKWNYKNKEKVRYVCRGDYDGDFTITCTARGWLGVQTCREIKCPKLDVQNAEIVGYAKSEYTNRERVQYTCKGDYEGDFTLTCKASGWHGAKSCREKTCTIPHGYDLIQNFKEQEWRRKTLRATKRYTCREGYKSTGGKGVATCTANGWTPDPLCEDKTTCSKPHVEHGFVVGPFAVGTFYYTCNEGYKPFTKGWWREIKCHEGVWSENPQCIDTQNCGQIPEIAHAVIEKPATDDYRDQDYVIINCEKGYNSKYGYITCTRGQWELNDQKTPETFCSPREKSCSPPPKVENAIIVKSNENEYLSDTQVTYQCRDKYAIKGADSITCKNGEWEMNNIKCIQRCETPKADQQTLIIVAEKDKYVNGDVITYECIIQGGKFDGNATCVNGMWTEPIECKGKDWDTEVSRDKPVEQDQGRQVKEPEPNQKSTDQSDVQATDTDTTSQTDQGAV